MEFYEAMNKNATIHEYEADEMSAEIIEKIIFSAFKVPTNERMGEWHYIIVKDKASVSKLLEMIPRGISDQNMDMLIKDWILGDSMSQAQMVMMLLNSIENLLKYLLSLFHC